MRPVARVDRELHVGAAGLDADAAQHGERGVAHVLVLDVGERLRRRHGDRVAGVHAHRVDVLDRADHHAVVARVAHDLELELLPAEQRLVDLHLADRAGLDALGHEAVELRGVARHAAAGAAEREAGAHQHGEAEARRERAAPPRRSWPRPARATSRPISAIAVGEQRAVLGDADRRRGRRRSARRRKRSSTPSSASARPTFRPVWPPSVGSTASAAQRALLRDHLLDELGR